MDTRVVGILPGVIGHSLHDKVRAPSIDVHLDYLNDISPLDLRL